MTDEDLTPDEERLLAEHAKKQRAVEYLRGVADLNLEIVRVLRDIPEGLSIDEIIARFHDHSPQKIADALKSAIEDEYIEKLSRDDEEWYKAITFEEP